MNEKVMKSIHDLRNVLSAAEMSPPIRDRVNRILNDIWMECLACGKEPEERDVAQPG